MKSRVITELLAHNKRFVFEKAYTPYETDKYPNKKLAVVACMDARLVELLPVALGLKNGDANIIKVAGSGVRDAFDVVMRSLLVSVYELGTEDILVIAHTNCGAQHMGYEEMFSRMSEAGISQDTLRQCMNDGFDYKSWFEGFGDSETYVRNSVETIRTHPLMPRHIRISGYLMDSITGELNEILC